jgi:hypothetical protein
MGGFGSGRWYRWDKRFFLDECLPIDVRRWQRDGLLRHGKSFVWCWPKTPEVYYFINVKVEPSQVILMFRHRARSEDWHEEEMSVALTHTPCHYGGQRIWFVCPSCSCRAAVLRCQRSHFVCRRCARVPYQSQSQTQTDRAIDRAWKIRRRLGADSGWRAPVRLKPKGMHSKTFDQLRNQMEEAEEIAFADLSMKLNARQMG